MKNPGQEGYWSDLSEAQRTPLEAIRSQCNDSDKLHSVIPLEIDQDDQDLVAIAFREQTDSSGKQSYHIRVCRVDLEDPGKVRWTGNGMVVPSHNGGEGLAAAFKVATAATADFWGNDDHDPIAAPQAAADYGEMDRAVRSPISEIEIGDDPEPEPEPEPEIPQGMVKCEKCHEVIPKDEAVQFSSGPPLGEIWVHANGGECDE